MPDSSKVLKSKGLSRQRGRSQMNQKQEVAGFYFNAPESFYSCLLAKGASRYLAF